MTITEIMYRIEDIAKPGTQNEQAAIRRMVLDYYNQGYLKGWEDAGDKHS